MAAAVSCDERGVTYRQFGRREESIAWDDLRSVAIETTDAGPFSDDVFFVLVGVAGVCRVPQGVPGADDLLARLQQLPGFANEGVIDAMSSAGNATFSCWQRGGE